MERAQAPDASDQPCDPADGVWQKEERIPHRAPAVAPEAPDGAEAPQAADADCDKHEGPPENQSPWRPTDGRADGGKCSPRQNDERALERIEGSYEHRGQSDIAQDEGPRSTCLHGILR